LICPSLLALTSTMAVDLRAVSTREPRDRERIIAPEELRRELLDHADLNQERALIAARSIASEGRESTHLSCFRRLSAIPEMAHDPADTEQRLDDRGCCAVSKAFMCRVST